MWWYTFIFFGAIIILTLIAVAIFATILAYINPADETAIYYRQLGKNFKRNFLKNIAKVLRPWEYQLFSC